jgi:hypothetical protein
MTEFAVHVEFECLVCHMEIKADSMSPDVLIVAQEFLSNHKHLSPTIMTDGGQ